MVPCWKMHANVLHIVSAEDKPCHCFLFHEACLPAAHVQYGLQDSGDMSQVICHCICPFTKIESTATRGSAKNCKMQFSDIRASWISKKLQAGAL